MLLPRVAGFAVAAAVIMLAGAFLVPVGQLGAVSARSANVLQASGSLPPFDSMRTGIAPAVAGAGPAATSGTTFSVTFSIEPQKPTKPARDLEITFRACNHGTCCDVTIDLGDPGFPSFSNCFTFTPLPNERPLGGFAPVGGPSGSVPSSSSSGGNLSVSANDASATFRMQNGTLWYSISGPAGYLVSGVAPPGGTTGIAPVGNLTVNGANLTDTFALSRGKTSAVQYRETGLIPGTSWCPLFLNCSTLRRALLAPLTPGVYPYSVESVAGYSASVKVNGQLAPLDGWVNVTERRATITVTFSPVLTAVTFNETGLAIGKTWHVKVTCTSSRRDVRGCVGWRVGGSGSVTATSDIITLMLRNGTYNWKITPIKGYELELNGVVDPSWSGPITVVVESKLQVQIGFVTLA